MIDAAESTALAHLADELFHSRLVRLAECPRLGEEFFVAFNILEEHGVFEREIDLVRIEDLKDQNLMPLILHPAKRFVELVEVNEQVGNNNDQTARFNL